MDSRNAVKLVDFVDSVDVSGSSEINILSQSSDNDFFSGSTHDFLKTSINNILFFGTFKK